jgi:hypothetical protein
MIARRASGFQSPHRSPPCSTSAAVASTSIPPSRHPHELQESPRHSEFPFDGILLSGNIWPVKRPDSRSNASR